MEHLETEVEEVFGRGAAVSLDHDQNVWRARAWSAKGHEVACSEPSRHQAVAIRNLRQKLAAKLAAGSETETSASLTASPRPHAGRSLLVAS